MLRLYPLHYSIHSTSFIQIEGGVQIDVFPAFKDTVSFELPDGQSLDIYKTPRELGLRLSRGIVMKDL